MKPVALVFLVFFSTSVFSQVMLEGKISDSKQNPLEMANIIALNKATGKLLTFGTSNAKGLYKLRLKSNTDYLIKVSYVGMQTAEISVSTTKINIRKDVVLQANNTLDEVKITHTMPVSVKGDTIVYDADSFTTGNEKKLEHVLEKLPGVEVEENGDIKVEGKKVKKVMVEGKDFFEGNTKLATKNIPANAVDKVEVLKNHNDIGQLRNVTDNEDNVALNIKLKAGKKRFWFGDVSAGAGLQERYRLHPNLFYYSPKYSANIIGDVNNLGEQSFTWSDYFKFMGGFSQLANGGNVNLESDIGFLMMQNEKAKAFNNKFGAANFNYNPNKNWSFGGFSIFSKTRTKLQNKLTKHYYGIKDKSIVEKVSDNTEQHNRLSISKLNASFVPNTNHQVDYDGIIKFSDFNQHNALYSSINNAIATNKNNQPTSTIHNLSYYFTLNDRNIFALQSQFLWKKEKPLYHALVSNLPFARLLQLDTLQSQFNINQLQQIETQKFETKLDYYYVLNNKSNLNFNAGFTNTQQQLNSRMQQMLDNNNLHEINTVQTKNDVNYNVSNCFMGVGVRFLLHRFTFYPSLTYHQFKATNSQLANAQNLYKFLPALSIKYKIRKAERLQFSYNKKIDFTNIGNIAEGYILKNYNQVFGGNKSLKNSQKHHFSLSYSNFDAFNFRNYHARVSYTKTGKNIRRRIKEINTFNVASLENSVHLDEMIIGSANYHKSYLWFKWNLSANANYNNYFNYVKIDNSNYKAVKNTLFSHSYSTKIISNLKSFFNFDIGYSINLNRYKNGNYTQQYIRHSPFVKIDIIFLKDFQLQSDFTYNSYQNKERVINQYSFWNSKLTYQKEDSNWEFNLSGTNILNTTSLNTNSGNELYNNTAAYLIQPRYIVFGVVYNL